MTEDEFRALAAELRATRDRLEELIDMLAGQGIGVPISPDEGAEMLRKLPPPPSKGSRNSD